MNPDGSETVTLLLRGKATPRQLELMLDSLLGQTMADFRLLAGRRELGPACADLLARYGEPRFVLLDDAEQFEKQASGRAVALVSPSVVLFPTCLQQLLAALDAAPHAPLAVCQATLFDGALLRPAASLPRDPSALAEALVLTPNFPDAALLRTESIERTSLDFSDPFALLLALLGQGEPVLVPDRLVISRVAGPPAPVQRRIPARLCSHDYIPADIEADRPPTLFVVVDTEAEFDWRGPFTPELTSVSALRDITSAQAIFDRYGLRPVYLIDYPVATQPESIAAMRGIAERGGAAIGAHLHPWTNPPFDTPIDPRLSFPGNLPRDVEAAKLDALLEAIERNFAVRTPFYKAGRYGLGPNTASLIAARGAAVDFSLLPETDLRHVHGPDFRLVNAIPYRVATLDLLAVPMTRADVGPLSRWWRLRGWLDTETAALLHVRAFLARAGLLERLTLTPEGVDARLQVVLLQTLLRRGHRLFVLHFHSPSLAVGHTPYVRNEQERLQFVNRIDTVCRWFFEELGGLPGRPWDLLDVASRALR